jgi:hypothetical protein
MPKHGENVQRSLLFSYFFFCEEHSSPEIGSQKHCPVIAKLTKCAVTWSLFVGQTFYLEIFCIINKIESRGPEQRVYLGEVTCRHGLTTV